MLSSLPSIWGLIVEEVIRTTFVSRSPNLATVEEGIDASAIAATFTSPPVVEVSLAVSFDPLALRVTDPGAIL